MFSSCSLNVSLSSPGTVYPMILLKSKSQVIEIPLSVSISSNVEATYTGTVGTQVKFCYVKKNGESDNNQQLSFRANAATTSVSTAIPNFTCSGNGSLGCTADNINKKVNSTHKSKEFDNVYNNAIDNFRKGTSTYSSAGTITLKGAQGKTVTSFTASMPSHMGQIY